MNQSTIHKLERIKAITAQIHELETELAALIEGDSKVKTKRTKQTYGKCAFEIIYDFLASWNQPFTAQEIKDGLHGVGTDMPTGTISSSLNLLQQENKVERVGNHAWRIRKPEVDLPKPNETEMITKAG